MTLAKTKAMAHLFSYDDRNMCIDNLECLSLVNPGSLTYKLDGCSWQVFQASLIFVGKA
jgi:hypothetical protein